MGIIDAAFEFVSTVVKMGDGSYLSIQTDKPMYYAGETVTGKVVASIISPKQADRVVVKVSGKEVVEWDEERSETIFEGEGENRRSQTIWHHHERKAKHKLFKDVIIVSQLPHILQPGTWEYPFSYTLRQDLPGCLKFKSHTPSGDPSWRNAGRHNDVKAKIVYSFKAAMQNGQLFSRDIKGCQEVVINSFFDWSKMQPAHAERSGNVYLCCCIPRGRVTVVADFDKGAYAAGETAQIKAVINNESKSNVGKMSVKLQRYIDLRDHSGAHKRLVDTVSRADYPGVPAGERQERSLPLTLSGKPGVFLPATNGRHVTVSYTLEVVCDIAFAFDIQASLPVVIYQPAPAVWGVQAFMDPSMQVVASSPMPMMPTQGGFAPGQMVAQPSYGPGTPLMIQGGAGAMPASPGGGYGSTGGGYGSTGGGYGTGSPSAPPGGVVVPNPLQGSPGYQ